MGFRGRAIFRLWAAPPVRGGRRPVSCALGGGRSHWQDAECRSGNRFRLDRRNRQSDLEADALARYPSPPPAGRSGVEPVSAELNSSVPHLLLTPALTFVC